MKPRYEVRRVYSGQFSPYVVVEKYHAFRKADAEACFEDQRKRMHDAYKAQAVIAKNRLTQVNEYLDKIYSNPGSVYTAKNPSESDLKLEEIPDLELWDLKKNLRLDSCVVNYLMVGLR